MLAGSVFRPEKTKKIAANRSLSGENRVWAPSATLRRSAARSSAADRTAAPAAYAGRHDPLREGTGRHRLTFRGLCLRGTGHGRNGRAAMR